MRFDQSPTGENRRKTFRVTIRVVTFLIIMAGLVLTLVQYLRRPAPTEPVETPAVLDSSDTESDNTDWVRVSPSDFLGSTDNQTVQSAPAQSAPAPAPTSRSVGPLRLETMLGIVAGLVALYMILMVWSRRKQKAHWDKMDQYRKRRVH